MSCSSRVFVNVDNTVAIATDVALPHAPDEYVQDALFRWIAGMERFHSFLQPKHTDSGRAEPGGLPGTQNDQSRGG